MPTEWLGSHDNKYTTAQSQDPPPDKGGGRGEVQLQVQPLAQGLALSRASMSASEVNSQLSGH